MNNNTEEQEYEPRGGVRVTDMAKQIGGGASKLYKMRKNVTKKEKHHNFMRKVAWKKEETSRNSPKVLNVSTQPHTPGGGSYMSILSEEIALSLSSHSGDDSDPIMAGWRKVHGVADLQE